MLFAGCVFGSDRVQFTVPFDRQSREISDQRRGGGENRDAETGKSRNVDPGSRMPRDRDRSPRLACLLRKLSAPTVRVTNIGGGHEPASPGKWHRLRRVCRNQQGKRPVLPWTRSGGRAWPAPPHPHLLHPPT